MVVVPRVPISLAESIRGDSELRLALTLRRLPST
jgi:hypothetical protein